MNTLNLISFYRPTDAVRRGGWVESLFVLAQKINFSLLFKDVRVALV